MSSIHEQGLMFKYDDEYSPIFDLAEQLKDRYDVFIICNNGNAKEVQKQIGCNFDILTSEEAFLNLYSKEEIE